MPGRCRSRAALDRIETLYKPYHAALTRLLAQTHVRFGRAVLIDCHSMPSSVRGQDAKGRSDFVLGDRHGTSASRALIDHAASALTAFGYKVAINRPYAGGFITEHYGAGRPRDCMPCRSRSTGRSTWMSGRSIRIPASSA